MNSSRSGGVMLALLAPVIGSSLTALGAPLAGAVAATGSAVSGLVVIVAHRRIDKLLGHIETRQRRQHYTL